MTLADPELELDPPAHDDELDPLDPLPPQADKITARKVPEMSCIIFFILSLIKYCKNALKYKIADCSSQSQIQIATCGMNQADQLQYGILSP